MTDTTRFPEHAYRGARAMVILHEVYLREWTLVWKEAQVQGLELPVTANGDYKSLNHLLRHVLRAARGYMTWMCEKLELPDPHLQSTPEPDEIGVRLDEYLEHLLDKWRMPLKDVPEPRFFEVYTSRWGVNYCIDAMLEHAVMHPLRHTFQLQELRKRMDQVDIVDDVDIIDKEPIA